MPTLRTLSGWILGVATLTSVALLGFVGLGPRTGAFRTLTVLTGSMEPAIPAGSVVVVRPLPTTEIRVGDVLTFTAPVDGDPVVTHRVIEVVEAGRRPVIRTQGDANQSPDPWRARMEEDTAWRVTRVLPVAGHVLAWLRQPAMGRLTVMVTPALLTTVLLVDIWSPKRGEPDSPLTPTPTR